MQTIFDFYEPSLYDLELGEADSSLETVEYYRRVVGSTPKRFLDIGAGTGRIAIPLLKDGHTGVCVDRSKRMLDRLIAKIGEQGLRSTATFIKSSFGPRGQVPPVDIALAPDDFLLHLGTVAELRRFFMALRTWLNGRGRFVTDIRARTPVFLRSCAAAPYTLRNFGLVAAPKNSRDEAFFHTTVWESFQPAGRQFQTVYRYDAIDGHGRQTRSFYRILNQRLHTNAEIRSAATEAGFSLIQVSSRNTTKRTRATFGGTLEFRAR
jgi:SAM-dependent methyltransferase